MADEPRWGTARRLEFIEFRLIWQGRVNRSDIAEVFGITLQQASADLGLYEESVPGNLVYDRNAKTFLPGPNFAPRFLRQYADRPLLQLAAIENGWIEKDETWFDELPPAGVIPMPPRRVRADLMRLLLEAIRTGSAVQVEYHGVSDREPTARRIAPHAIAYDGVRWHARAWCALHNDFRDFVLSRIDAVEAAGPSPVDQSLDREWHELIELEIAPNPELSASARRAIVREYQMSRSARLRLSMRAALVFYFIQQHNMDLDHLPPKRRQLVLLNRAEALDAVEHARVASRAGLDAVAVIP